MKDVTSTEKLLREALQFDTFVEDSIYLALNFKGVTGAAMQEQTNKLTKRVDADKYWNEFYHRLTTLGEPALTNFVTTQKVVEESLIKTSEALVEILSELEKEIHYIFDNEESFLGTFGEDDWWDLQEVSFTSACIRFVYVLYCGKHVEMSVEMSDYADWRRW